MEPAVIFQDADIVILDKPPGLLVHAASGAHEATLADWLLKKYPQIAGVGEEGRRGVVHRLDRETSGILVAALTPAAYVRLKKQFARREVRKTYRAFVYGAMKEERGVIERPIGRSASGNRSARLPSHIPYSISHTPARESQTTFKTLLRSPVASYLELYPRTGRTHQIRIHLSALQHPVVCDGRYAPNRPAVLGFKRLALHAYTLSLSHPITKKEMSFKAPLPEDFIEAEKELAVAA